MVRGRWTPEKQALLEELLERRTLYKAAEAAILSGKPYSYTIGPRSKTNFALNLTDLRKAIRELNAEIAELEDIKYGGGAKRTQAVIPRDY
jgi:hypothetical protein